MVNAPARPPGDAGAPCTWSPTSPTNLAKILALHNRVGFILQVAEHQHWVAQQTDQEVRRKKYLLVSLPKQGLPSIEIDFQQGHGHPVGEVQDHAKKA